MVETLKMLKEKLNLKSPNFSDPGPAAWKHAQQEALVENICWKCSGAKFMFN